MEEDVDEKDEAEFKSILFECVDGFFKAYMDRKKTGDRKAYIKAINAVGEALFFSLELIEDNDGGRSPDYMRCFDWPSN